MYRPRIIPVLLLKNKGLVKTIKFKNERYIGDPINAVKIFNDLHADELVFLDILASKENRTISVDFIKKVGEEANMPFSVGGGINSISQIKNILAAGAEKVILNTVLGENPAFAKIASKQFGSSTIAACIDVKKNLLGKEKVFIFSGSKVLKYNPVEYAKLLEENGVGEIIIQSMEHDGMMNGYNIELIYKISSEVTVPVVALGGASSIYDMKTVIKNTYCSAVAAGSMFVYHGPRKAVLINMPDKRELFIE